MASWVSAKPISGTVPSCSFVAGSAVDAYGQASVSEIAESVGRTSNIYFFSALRVHPFSTNVTLELDQGWVFETKL
jgi:hypothetical protein